MMHILASSPLHVSGQGMLGVLTLVFVCVCVCVCVCSSVSDESKQQSSELSEQLKLSAQENGAMRLELEELSKRLEMSELMLQQVTDHRPGGSPQWTPNGEGLQRFIGGHFS